MSFEIRPYAPQDLEALRVLAGHSSLAREFEKILGRNALEGVFADPFAPSGLRWMAFERGTPVGFCFTFVLNGIDGGWSMVRIGVAEGARRRGLGSILFEKAKRGIRAHAADCVELCMGAWLPNDAAAAFAARHGLPRVRSTWMMERPSPDRPEVAWPDGVEPRLYDGTERMMRDWNDTYNRSFVEHYHYVPSTLDETRAILARPDADPKGLMLAYRGDRCVGFCRNELHAGRGEIGILGVAPEARRMGLGRALLCWGVSWLMERDAKVTLLVDGENESAQNLYRSEGFDVLQTRALWALRDF
jgi:mycothiol synthase